MNEEQLYSPWKDPDSPWKTQASYEAWLRGTLRRGWSKYPLKIIFQKNNRFKAPLGRDGREVWAATCNICKETKIIKHLQVDHIHPAGSMKKTHGGVGGFVRRLFPTQAGMQFLCKPCHNIVSLSERRGISFDEARVEKEVILVCKQSTKKQLEWMKQHHLCDEEDVKNAKTRRAAIARHLHQQP